MKDLSGVNRIFQLIVGILFIAFGSLSLINPVIAFGDIVWVAGGITLAALIRLILICLPANGALFAGSAALEITAGITEALFGLFFILDALVYVEFLYPLIAVLLLAGAIVRIWQSVLVKRKGLNGWGSYLFIAILFLAAAAGLVIFEYMIKINMQYEIAGAAAFMYGFFLAFSSFYKLAAAGFTPAFESEAEPVMEVAGEEVVEYPEALDAGRKLAE